MRFKNLLADTTSRDKAVGPLGKKEPLITHPPILYYIIDCEEQALLQLKNSNMLNVRETKYQTNAL